MSCTRIINTNTILARQSASVLKNFNGTHIASRACRPGLAYAQHITSPRRQFSTTRPRAIKEFFPAPDAPHIRVTEAAWSHPVYTEEQMKDVVVAHREAKTMSDKVALFMVKVLRFGLDTATGYKHDKAVALGNKDPEAARQKYAMSERKWMIRYVLLAIPISKSKDATD
jgi:ubiquinol oxidase